MATSHPRVQVTVDPELGAALDALGPRHGSRSRQIRDLALRGAEIEQEARERREQAIAFLVDMAAGRTRYDPASALEAHAQREAGYE